MNLNGSVPEPVTIGGDSHPDPEVSSTLVVKAKRRRLSAGYKQRVLDETERLSEGEIGAYLRKNGLYWSSLVTWRRQQKAGVLSETQSIPRGRKKAEIDHSGPGEAALRKQVQGLEESLRRANLILEVQKKVLSLCAELEGESNSSRVSCSKR